MLPREHQLVSASMACALRLAFPVMQKKLAGESA